MCLECNAFASMRQNAGVSRAALLAAADRPAARSTTLRGPLRLLIFWRQGLAVAAQAL